MKHTDMRSANSPLSSDPVGATERDVQALRSLLRTSAPNRPAAWPALSVDALASHQPRVTLSERELAEVIGRSPLIRLGVGRVAVSVPRTFLQVAAALLILLGGVFVARQAGSAAFSDELRAVVLYRNGQVLGLQYGTTEEVAGAVDRIETGMTFGSGTWLQTAGDSVVDLALTDGVLLRVQENSSVRLMKLEKRPGRGRAFRLYVERGRLLAIADRLDAFDEFSIHTPDARLAVRGSSFRVSTDGDGTVAYAVEGQLEISSRSERPETVILESRQVARLQRDESHPVLAYAPDTMQLDARDLYTLEGRRETLPRSSLVFLRVGDIAGGFLGIGSSRSQPGRLSHVQLRNGDSVQGQVKELVGRRLSFESDTGKNLSFDIGEIKDIQYAGGND